MHSLRNTAILLALVLGLACTTIARADEVPDDVRPITAKYHLDWDADAFEGYSFYAVAWKLRLNDDAEAVRVERGDQLDHHNRWMIAVFAISGEIDGDVTVGVLKAFEGVATAQISVERFVQNGSDVAARTTTLAVKEVNEDELVLETRRVVEYDKDGEVLRDTDDSGDGDGDDGDKDDSDDDGLPHGDETTAFSGPAFLNSALVLLALAGFGALGLGVVVVSRIRS